MKPDPNKLDVYFVAIALQFRDGSLRPQPDYDAEAGPILYRAHCESHGEGLVPRVWLSSYPILRYTPQGVWIGRGIMKDKFVNLKADRKWAAVTKEEAMFHLECRKSRQLQILNWKLTMCEEINHYLKNGNMP